MTHVHYHYSKTVRQTFRKTCRRPSITDLMKITNDLHIHEINICDLQEGIFYSKLVCSTENDTVEIDSRTSDIALAACFTSN